MSLAPIFEKSVDKLATILEEGARANARATGRFIEPAEGTLRRSTSKRHHIVFGRRGSGKSSLLFKSVDTLSAEGRPTAYVDLEPYKGHHYPDLLISVLLAALKKFNLWLENEKIYGDLERRWYSVYFFRSRHKNNADKESLIKDLKLLISELENQLHAADGAEMNTKRQSAQKNSQALTESAKIGATMPPVSAGLESGVTNSRESTNEIESQEQFKRSKKDYLHRKILNFQELFQKFTNLTKGDCFLFLDDLYHIHRADQPHLLDYFHRIAKGNNLWLKIGSIRNRSTWYVNAPQPTGLKLEDDAGELNLDLTLEKFSVSREFLRSVIDTYIEESKAPRLDQLVAEGGMDRLVLASGGVTRDFLGLFRSAIVEAKERLTKKTDHARGEKIGAEDVNLAAGAYGEKKKEEFQRDTLEDRQRLEDAFTKIKKFCLSRSKCNIFLVDQDVKGEDNDLVQELVDLRLIHQVTDKSLRLTTVKNAV